MWSMDDPRFSILDMLLYADIQLLWIFFSVWLVSRYLDPARITVCRISESGTVIEDAKPCLPVFFIRFLSVCLVGICLFFIGFLCSWAYRFWSDKLFLDYILATLPQSLLDLVEFVLALAVCVFLAKKIFEKIYRVFDFFRVCL